MSSTARTVRYTIASSVNYIDNRPDSVGLVLKPRIEWLLCRHPEWDVSSSPSPSDRPIVNNQTNKPKDWVEDIEFVVHQVIRRPLWAAAQLTLYEIVPNDGSKLESSLSVATPSGFDRSGALMSSRLLTKVDPGTFNKIQIGFSSDDGACFGDGVARYSDDLRGMSEGCRVV